MLLVYIQYQAKTKISFRYKFHRIYFAYILRKKKNAHRTSHLDFYSQSSNYSSQKIEKYKKQKHQNAK